MGHKTKQPQLTTRKVKKAKPPAKVRAKKVKPQPTQPQNASPTQVSSPAGLLTLQQTIGNQAVTRLIQRKKVTVTQQTRPGIQRMFDESKRKRREARTILQSLHNKEWALAKDKTKQENITYDPAIFMGSHQWVKGFRGVGGWSGGGMNEARKNAKSLRNNTQLKGNDRLNRISEIAGQAHQVTNKDHFWGTNWQHSAAMARKIVFYLVDSIPATETNLEDTLTLVHQNEADTLKAKIKNILLDNVATDTAFIDDFISNNQLVKDILDGSQQNVPVGRVIFFAQVEKQHYDIQNTQEQQTQPEMALGFSNALTFKDEQLRIMEKFNRDPLAQLTSIESDYLDKNKKGQRDHRLKEDISDKLPGKPKMYFDWEQAGWLEDVSYQDATNKDWKLGFDKATNHIAIRGGKIHFDLSGFRRDDIANIKQSKFYLPYGPTMNSPDGPQTSFKNTHPFGSIGQSELKYGMGITHWELGQIMYNKNLWDITIFYRYDKQNNKPVEMQSNELNNLGLTFMG